MQIGEFAQRANTTPRALRHYEAQGLLHPDRTASGYRTYHDNDLDTVERIRLMIDAGLPTRAIADYLECLQTGAEVRQLAICPALQTELARIEERLALQQERLKRTRQALRALTSAKG